MTQQGLEAELNTIAARIAREYSENESYGRVTVEPLQSNITGPVRAGLLVLFAAVAFVLLLACVNVASLMLARATTRGREIATRVALGAGRGRIIRQLLTESVLLSLIGGAAGIGLAFLIVNGLLNLSAGQLPRGAEVRLDGAVLLFATGLSLLTGLLFGIVPALRTTSKNLQGTLREGGRGLAGTEGRHLRNGLVVLEVALALMLVTAAGLMTRSFIQLLNVDPGFQAERLLAVNFTISTTRNPSPRHAQMYAQLVENVRQIPGVVSAGAVKDAPFQGEGERWQFRTPQMVLSPGQDEPAATIMHVSDGYFHTIGARILDGREFEPTDRRDGPMVIVVNEALARQYFSGQQAAGQTLTLDGDAVPIVGVVGDIRQSAMEEPGVPTIYVNNVQNTRVKVTLVTRTQGDPLAMVAPVRDAVRALDPDQTITSIFTYDDIVSEAVAQPRLLTVLLVSFGALGLILGALGIYGVLAFTVSQKHREIGMRIALGAHPHRVQRMFVGRGLAVAGLGIAIGLVAALALGRYLSSVLFGIEPTDPLTYVFVTGVLLTVAFLASWLPARRAASVDPITALRSD
jgi:predicted permease